MAVNLFGTDQVPQLFNSDGTIALSGRLDFFESGTVTPKDVFSDRALTINAGSSITLDAAGRITVYMDGTYRVRFFDTNGVQQWELDDVNIDVTGASAAAGAAGGTLQLVDNGSFEIDADGDGIPDLWARTVFTAGTVALDATTSAHGMQSIKMTSTGNGGGSLVSSNFKEISFLRDLTIQFAMFSSVVDVRNIVRLQWFQGDQSPSSTPTTTVLDDAATNPTVWTLFTFTVTPPTDAKYVKVELIGCDSSDPTPGSTNFDDVILFQQVPGVVATTQTGLVQRIAEYSAHNSGVITVLNTPTTVIDLLVTEAIEIGDIFKCEFELSGTKGGTGGEMAITIIETTFATIGFMNNEIAVPAENRVGTVAAAALINHRISSEGVAIAAASASTITLRARGQSLGSNMSVADGASTFAVYHERLTT